MKGRKIKPVEVGYITSAFGIVATTSFAGALLSDDGLAVQKELAKGDSQTILSIFTVLLICCSILLFRQLMKTITENKQERDVREAKYYAALEEMRVTLQANGTLVRETAQAFRVFTDKMDDVSKEMQKCHDSQIKMNALSKI